MKYKLKKGKYVFTSKDGINFPLSLKEVTEMRKDLVDIEKNEEQKFHCVVEATDDPFQDCVWDTGEINDCVHAMQGIKKDDCQFWVKK